MGSYPGGIRMEKPKGPHDLYNFPRFFSAIFKWFIHTSELIRFRRKKMSNLFDKPVKKNEKTFLEIIYYSLPPPPYSHGFRSHYFIRGGSRYLIPQHPKRIRQEHPINRERVNGRTFNNSLGEGIFRFVGCSDVLVPLGIKVRAKTQPNP